MAANKDDLLFLARLHHELGRPEDALDYLDQLVAISPQFAEEHRNLFVVVYKELIDTIRHTIRTLKAFHDNEEHEHHLLKADMINGILKRQYDKLVEICQRGITLIQDRLIPNAVDMKALAFFNTKIGDFHRYMGECGSGDQRREHLLSAKKCYENALAICADKLPNRDPVRLEAILVAAVFEYEHMRKADCAIALLKSALGRLGPAVEGEDENTERTISIMKRNVLVWTSSA